MSRTIRTAPARHPVLQRQERSDSRSQRLERTLSRALAGVCLVFGAQTLPMVLTGESAMNEAWSWSLGVLMYLALAATIVTGITGRFSRRAAIAVMAVYLLILITWSFAADHIDTLLPRSPWPWYLFNVATAAAAMTFSDLIATAYTLLVGVTYFLVRLTPPGGAVGAEHALLDTGYAFILGITTVLIVGILRRAAAAVDRAETAAVVRYGAATREHAAEVARMNVDALLHDNVMSSLLAAARAGSAADSRYALALARKALDVISESTGTPGEEPVSLQEVTQRFSAICDELGIGATLTAQGLERTSVPGTVAEAFFAASLQALMNSVQHAGPGLVHRDVDATWADDELTVTLTDDGVGFDPTEPSARLGIRKSIVERLESVGGTAEVVSAPGQGTRVILTWNTRDGWSR